MNSLNPLYRIKINTNLLKYPLFFDYLKVEFANVIKTQVNKKNLQLDSEYTFTIYSIPVQWGNYIIPKLRVNDSLEPEKQDKKLLAISNILYALDPINPQPVNLSFTLSDIIAFVCSNIKLYSALVTGGRVYYFGIESSMWFDDYPITVNTVLKAVDYGTTKNYPANLFNESFSNIRDSLMDLFTFYMQNYNGSSDLVVDNVDI